MQHIQVDTTEVSNGSARNAMIDDPKLCCIIRAEETCSACQESWCNYHMVVIEKGWKPSPMNHYVGSLTDKKHYFFCPVKQCLIHFPVYPSIGRYIVSPKIGNRPIDMEYLLVHETKTAVLPS